MRGRRSIIDWSQVDWTQTNKVIAESIGFSRVGVLLARKRFSKPKAPAARGAGTPAHRRMVQWGMLLNRAAQKRPLNFEGVDLTGIAAACARLRDAALKAGGKRPRGIGKYKAPRTGLTNQVRAWIMSREEVFEVADVMPSFPTATRSQIQGAVGHAQRQGLIIAISGGGSRKRTYQRKTKS